MKYTTEQAVEKALSVSKLLTFGNSFVDMSHDELAEFANLIRKETLLEAADKLKADSYIDDYGDEYVDISYVDELRRMAEEGE